MGYEYKNLEDLKRNFPFIRSFSNPAEIKLIIVSEDERKRRETCDIAKGVLDGMLKDEKKAKSIKGYEVKIIDVQNEKNDLYFTPDWIRAGNNNGFIFVPIYHNADNHRNLAQNAFDNRRPIVLSVSSQGYDSIHNISKRNCYDYLEI